MPHWKKLFFHYMSYASCKQDHTRPQKVLDHNLAQRDPGYSLIYPKADKCWDLAQYEEAVVFLQDTKQDYCSTSQERASR